MLKKTLLALAIALGLSCAAGLASATTRRDDAAQKSAAKKRRTPAASKVEVVWQGKRFRRGDRVRVTSYAGTIKPDESGYEAEINADAGRTGTVIRGAKRQTRSYFKPDPREPLQVLLIRWDRQTWTRNDTAQTVTLEEFESTIHADYLKVIKAAEPKPERALPVAPHKQP
jgi:hypothetical protein